MYLQVNTNPKEQDSVPVEGRDIGDGNDCKTQAVTGATCFLGLAVAHPYFCHRRQKLNVMTITWSD